MSISTRKNRLLCAAIVSLGLLFMMTGAVSAHPTHAKVNGSTPAANSTISTAPATIMVTTAENMKPGATNSNLFVYGPSGDLISQGDATVDLNNPKQMSVKIKPEKKGTYVVRWQTVSADDNDPDDGAFVFNVGTTATTAAASSTAQSTSSSSSGTPIWVAIVTGVVALLVGIGAGFGIGRAGRAAPIAPASIDPTSSESEKSGVQRQ